MNPYQNLSQIMCVVELEDGGKEDGVEFTNVKVTCVRNSGNRTSVNTAMGSPLDIAERLKDKLKVKSDPPGRKGRKFIVPCGQLWEFSPSWVPHPKTPPDENQPEEERPEPSPKGDPHIGGRGSNKGFPKEIRPHEGHK